MIAVDHHGMKSTDRRAVIPGRRYASRKAGQRKEMSPRPSHETPWQCRTFDG